MTPYMPARTPDRSSMDGSERRLETWVKIVPFALLVMSMIPYLLTQRPTAWDSGSPRTGPGRASG